MLQKSFRTAEFESYYHSSEVIIYTEFKEKKKIENKSSLFRSLWIVKRDYAYFKTGYFFPAAS